MPSTVGRRGWSLGPVEIGRGLGPVRRPRSGCVRNASSRAARDQAEGAVRRRPRRGRSARRPAGCPSRLPAGRPRTPRPPTSSATAPCSARSTKVCTWPRRTCGLVGPARPAARRRTDAASRAGSSGPRPSDWLATTRDLSTRPTSSAATSAAPRLAAAGPLGGVEVEAAGEHREPGEERPLRSLEQARRTTARRRAGSGGAGRVRGRCPGARSARASRSASWRASSTPSAPPPARARAAARPAGCTARRPRRAVRSVSSNPGDASVLVATKTSTAAVAGEHLQREGRPRRPGPRAVRPATPPRPPCRSVPGWWRAPGPTGTSGSARRSSPTAPITCSQLSITSSSSCGPSTSIIDSASDRSERRSIARRLGDRGDHRGGVRHRRELHDADPVAESSAPRRGRPRRPARLADAAGAGEGRPAAPRPMAAVDPSSIGVTADQLRPAERRRPRRAALALGARTRRTTAPGDCVVDGDRRCSTLAERRRRLEAQLLAEVAAELRRRPAAPRPAGPLGAARP